MTTRTNARATGPKHPLLAANRALRSGGGWRHGQQGFLKQVDLRAGHHERLEVRGETCLVLLGVAEEASAGSLDTYDGSCGKARGPGVARLEGRAEQPAVLQCCPPGRLAGPPPGGWISSIDGATCSRAAQGSAPGSSAVPATRRVSAAGRLWPGRAGINPVEGPWRAR